MSEHPNKITVRTTGEFELRDPQTNIDINQVEQEVLETSFVIQMLALKRLEVVKGKQKVETNIEESNQNPQYGEEIPAKTPEPTIRELNEDSEARTQRRGRPAK